MSKRGRVLAAMSGGVDSSVAAALLAEQGYEVIGVTMQIWEAAGPHSCCAPEGVEDARRVAAALGIRHYTFNMRDAFRATVLEPFAGEYMAGRTPNPCINCNRYLKFDALLERAAALEAQWVATGHYARVERDAETGRWILRRGVDSAKDQSYALYCLTQEQLSQALFPLGGFTKQQTREKAAGLGLSVAGKWESQDICFAPGGNYARFLREFAPQSVRPGPILDMSGKVLGDHQGVAFFTVGQRHGLGVAVGEPLYVVALDPERAAVIVGPEGALYSEEVWVSDVNYVGLADMDQPVRAAGQLRYTAVAEPCTLEPAGPKRVRAVFDAAQRAATPGQAAVFYDGDTVLCGGTIEAARRRDAERDSPAGTEAERERAVAAPSG